jgi:hypothetical protein
MVGVSASFSFSLLQGCSKFGSYLMNPSTFFIEDLVEYFEARAVGELHFVLYSEIGYLCISL